MTWRECKDGSWELIDGETLAVVASPGPAAWDIWITGRGFSGRRVTLDDAKRAAERAVTRG